MSDPDSDNNGNDSGAAVEDDVSTPGPNAETGTIADHAPRALQPFVVAPTLAADFNTLSLDLVAVACLQVPDLLFEFDSSFPQPALAPLLAGIAPLRARHQSQNGLLPPLSVFGHADPVGDDEYNKQLSGRRAIAIYAVLTHDLGLWDQLFDHPQGGDDWKARKVAATMAAATGQPSTTPRAQLSQAYMTLLLATALQKSDFLGRGADAKGKADFQGCSEFNPVRLLSTTEAATLPKDQRDADNAINRRVIVFLFRPGLKVDPGRWPCPTALVGTADCRKRFFGPPKTGDLRRAPGPQRREFAATPDTFACRFYDRIARVSPCEGPVPVLLRVNPLIFFETPVKDLETTDAASASTSSAASASLVAAPPVTAPQVIAARNIVLVKKPHTKPKRVLVVLKTDKGFDGTGLLTVAKGDRIAFFRSAAATDTQALRFDGNDNRFKGAQLRPAGPGVRLFAEGLKASDGIGDVVLTLHLSGGTKPPGPDARAALTAVELQLDICVRRTDAATDPAPLSEADKIAVGRSVHKQSGTTHERAMLIVRRAKPAAFNGTLTLTRILAPGAGALALFDATAEKPAAGQTALANPHEFPSTSVDAAKGLRFFVEGRNAFTALRATGYRLGIQGVEADGDHVAMTIVDMVLIARIPTTKSARDPKLNLPPRTHEVLEINTPEKRMAIHSPSVLLRNTKDIELEAKVKPAGHSFEWTVEDNPGPGQGKPTLSAATGQKVTLKTDASGGYAISLAVAKGPAIVYNLVLVDITIDNSTVSLLGTNFRDTSRPNSVGTSSGAFNINNPAVCAMHATANIKLTAGGRADLKTHLDRIVVGIAQNMTSDDAAAQYAGGGRERERVPTRRGLPSVVVNPATVVVDLAPLVLDRGGAAATRATGGDTIFLSQTRSTPTTGDTRRVETCDSPAVGFDRRHPEFGKPATQPATAISGNNGFRMFLTAFSRDALFTYVTFGSSNWNANYGGPIAPGPAGGWSQGSAAITGDATLTAIAHGKEAQDAGCEVRPPVFLDFIIDAR